MFQVVIGNSESIVAIGMTTQDGVQHDMTNTKHKTTEAHAGHKLTLASTQ